MAISLKHSTAVVVPDDGVSPVGTNEWNAEHNMTMDSGFVLGRNSSGNGPVEQVHPWVQMTQAAYDALPVKDPNTLYVIVG